MTKIRHREKQQTNTQKKQKQLVI